MSLELKIIRELAHSGIKTLDALSGLIELFDLSSNGGLHDAETRTICRSSIQSLSQAIGDLRLLVLCDHPDENVRGSFNWQTALHSGFGRRFLEANTVTVEKGTYEGVGHADLVRAVVINLCWFSRRFCSGRVTVHVREEKKNGVPWVCLDWDFGQGISVPPEFSTFDPFTPMFPKESLSLDKSTGLVLHTVKQIAALHGGTFLARLTGENLKLEFSCPQSVLAS